MPNSSFDKIGVLKAPPKNVLMEPLAEQTRRRRKPRKTRQSKPGRLGVY